MGNKFLFYFIFFYIDGENLFKTLFHSFYNGYKIRRLEDNKIYNTIQYIQQ